jgi:hypothetical protein
MGPRVGLLSTVGAALAASAVLVSTPAMAGVSHAPQAVSQVKYTWRSYGWYVVQSSCIAAGQHLVSIHVVLAYQCESGTIPGTGQHGWQLMVAVEPEEGG